MGIHFLFNKSMEEKQWSVGIDIAKDKFDVCLKVRVAGGVASIKGSRRFDNTAAGFRNFYAWTQQRNGSMQNIVFVMEATGVYYENLAYYLYEQGARVCVELANKVKHFAKSQNVKTKTDKVDAALIADMGLERYAELRSWQPMSPVFREMRDVSRLVLSYQCRLTALQSQLHAMQHAHGTSAVVLQVQQEQIDSCSNAIKTLREELRTVVAQDSEMSARVEKVCTIKGACFDTVVAILCETNGFLLFRNGRQLTSYAGLDVKLNESGYHKGRSSISKHGNSRIRQVLFMPALCAVRYNKPIRALHERLCAKHPDARKIGVVAGMRKLLLLIYTLWKNDTTFDEHYQWQSGKIG